MIVIYFNDITAVYIALESEIHSSYVVALIMLREST